MSLNILGEYRNQEDFDDHVAHEGQLKDVSFLKVSFYLQVHH